MKKLITPFILLFICAGPAAAQVSIAPTSLFIDDQNRFGTFLVLNSSNQTQEVQLEFIFGYPATDEEGNTYMRYDDPVAESEFSIAEWIRGFPRNFTLEPGARQTVRLTVRPPADLPDGMYWTRIRTTSNALSPDIDEEIQDGVSARITFRFEQITAAFYKKGNVNTGLDIKDKEIQLNGDKATIFAEVHRTGNAPFLGSMQLRVINDSGDEVYSNQNFTTVYLNALRKMDYDISGWPAGSYTAELTFLSERSDISARDIVQTDPVTVSIDFQIEQ